MTLYTKFGDELLSKFSRFKASILKEEATEMEIIDFVECYTNQIKDGTCVVQNLDAEISMYIQIIIPVKTSFFLQGIQQSSLTTKVTI